MLLPFKEIQSDNTVFINPKSVVAVFVAHEGEFQGKTVINMTNGNLITPTDQLEVVGMINGALKDD